MALTGKIGPRPTQCGPQTGFFLSPNNCLGVLPTRLPTAIVRQNCAKLGNSQGSQPKISPFGSLVGPEKPPVITPKKPPKLPRQPPGGGFRGTFGGFP